MKTLHVCSMRSCAIFFRCFEVLHNMFKAEAVTERNQDEILRLSISNIENQLCLKKQLFFETQS